MSLRGKRVNGCYKKELNALIIKDMTRFWNIVLLIKKNWNSISSESNTGDLQGQECSQKKRRMNTIKMTRN